MPDIQASAPAEPAPKPENTFRDVISLLAIVVTLTIGLLASIQREPVFTYKVEVSFLLLVSGPLSGLRRLSRAVNHISSARLPRRAAAFLFRRDAFHASTSSSAVIRISRAICRNRIGEISRPL